MIDERQQELASLYALDLLEGEERARFEAALARDPDLQALVRDLCVTSSSLVHTAPPAVPPAALRSRVLASISAASEPAATLVQEGNVVRPFGSGLWQFIPWAAAAGLALTAAWFGQRYATTRAEADGLRNQQALAEVELQSIRQQLEAERIVTRRQLQEVEQKLATTGTQLGELRDQVGDRERLLAEARNQLAERERLLAERNREVTTLTQRVDALAGASAEIGRQLGEAKEQIASLAMQNQELKTQGDLANLKVTALASMLKDSPTAQAIAVWDPQKQEGLLKVEKLPALLPSQDYQLWIVDPQYPDPVDGGVFTVDPQTGERTLRFKPKQPVRAVNAFAITRERKGGVEKSAGPMLLLGK